MPCGSCRQLLVVTLISYQWLRERLGCWVYVEQLRGVLWIHLEGQGHLRVLEL